jgi:hypothetical protein
MRNVSVIIDHQVRMSSGPVQPPVNFVAILLESHTHSPFRTSTIVPRGSGADVTFVAKAFPKFVVGAADMFA